jgi:D-alanyl-D-alanine carboxypeptidase/D-alanyl-D-alanine-endopeptidase (penicillin-binding protein 4)
MGRPAHLPKSDDPSDLTFAFLLEKWKTVPLRLAATAAAIVAFFLVPAAQAGSRSAFQARLARALHARHVSPGRTGAIVFDLQTGSTLFAHNPRLALRPASNEKLATTYAALSALGPSFRIETDVLGEGQQSGTIWQGNLVLKGYGDPALSFAQVNSLARQVAAAGIRQVTGRILGDESWFDTRRTGLGWKPDFYLHESPALSALVVNRGWTGRYETGRPALMAAQILRRDLRRAGVTVHGGAALGVASVQAASLASVQSARLAVLVRHMDVYSDNFYAEMLLKEVGAVQGAGGSAAAGIAVERQLLSDAGVPLAGVGWSTAPASRSSTAGRRSASQRSSGRCGRTATCGRISCPPCPSPVKPAPSSTGCGRHRPEASCVRRRVRPTTRRRSRASSVTATPSRFWRTAAR